MTDAELFMLDTLLENFEDASSGLDWVRDHGNPDAERRARQEKSEIREEIFKFCKALKSGIPYVAS